METEKHEICSVTFTNAYNEKWKVYVKYVQITADLDDNNPLDIMNFWRTSIYNITLHSQSQRLGPFRQSSERSFRCSAGKVREGAVDYILIYPSIFINMEVGDTYI